ncbi:MAG: M28 family peptidase [Treponema sp.]|nr:M28 family peptidase [Treponema sp.]
MYLNPRRALQEVSTHEAHYHNILYHHFQDFIALETDRYRLLKSLLDEFEISYLVITIAGNRHFFVSPEPASGGFLGFPLGGQTAIILVAHYDRVPGSPGANDNSAAVFELIEAALKLREEQVRSWLIIFTDKEEILQGEGIRDQGSYTLAMGLRDAGFGGAQVFIFDACGTGDTLIISKTADHLMKYETGPGITRTRHLVQQLRTRALETARHLDMDRVLLVPTPFSDDAGFFRAGIAAQTITMLPAEEAAALGSLLRTKPDIADALFCREVPNEALVLPKTWRCLNSPEDSYLRLTPQYFPIVVRFACALCGG